MRLRHIFRILIVPTIVIMAVSACTPLQLLRAGVEPSSEAGQTLLALPDYTPGNCVWVKTGMEARGFKPEAVAYSVRYATKEGNCCPTRTGGDLVDALCQPTGDKGNWRYDPSDTGVMQFNGYLPSGGTRDGTPARKFCVEGVRRLLGETWTDEVTYPCNQWELLGDPELQLDMLAMMVDDCGFGPWRPVNGNYGCWNYDPYG